MKVLIICSEKSGKLPEDEFHIKTDYRFANAKFIPHLKDKRAVCTVCGKNCVWCRKNYNLNFENKISEIVKLPDIYRMFEDEPLKYLPDKFKEHDVAVVIGVHQDILLELPNILKKSGCKALIVPCEGSDWVSRWTREMVIKECEELEVEYAFPKPFCTLNKGKFETINKFIDEFKLGKPKFKLYVNKENIIVKAEVIISAPCGNGYNIAKHLIGKKIGEEAKKSVAKFWHSYPCMGGMKIDSEIGDTPLHIGGYAHYSALENAEICKI
jgi:hypothetical protein